VDIVGDKWSLLIIRDALDGLTRFSQFQRSLGVAKNILSARLRALVEAGVLAVQDASDGSAYQEYVLTPRGQDLFDLVVGLRQWGQAHAFADGEPHAVLVDARTGDPLPRLSYTTPDGRAISASDARVVKVSDSAAGRGAS
jgi:DNA-binding HxlR family transcriptional regulator